MKEEYVFAAKLTIEQFKRIEALLMQFEEEEDDPSEDYCRAVEEEE